MSARGTANPAQLGFDDLLATAEAANGANALAQKFAHFPSTLENALPFYRMRTLSTTTEARSFEANARAFDQLILSLKGQPRCRP